MYIIERWIIAKYSIRNNIKRNKKTWIIATAIVLVLCAIAVYLEFFAPYISVTCHNGSCEYVFGCTPAEFTTADLDVPSEISSLRKNAHVDGRGNLIFDTTRWQYHKLKNSEWIKDFPELKEWPCIYLSEDYYRITITVTPEMKAYGSAELKELEYALNAALNRIRLIDMIKYPDKKDFYQRLIFYKEIDEVTGATLFEEYVEITRNDIEYQAYDGWE